MLNDRSVEQALAGMESELRSAMVQAGRVVEVPAGTELLREGGYVRELPVVLSGRLRVYIGHEDKELLLYHIAPAESCVMSFSALLDKAPSKVNAVVERDAVLLLLPEREVREQLRNHPGFALLMLRLYQERYTDMVHTVEQVAFGDLPSRLLDHLERMARINGSPWVDVRHSRLAQELGSAREVITRTLRKLERQGAVETGPLGIRVKR